MARIFVLLSMASLFIMPALSSLNLEGLTDCVAFFGDSDAKGKMGNILDNQMENLPDKGKSIQSNYDEFFERNSHWPDRNPNGAPKRSPCEKERVSALKQ
jgi:hypothetical protein